MIPVWGSETMFKGFAVSMAALAAVFSLSNEAAAAGSCDNLEGQDVVLAGTVDKVAGIGVIFFTDRKTGCDFGLVAFSSDPPCKQGNAIEVKGKLRKNAYVKGIYDIERNRRSPDGLDSTHHRCARRASRLQRLRWWQERCVGSLCGVK